MRSQENNLGRTALRFLNFLGEKNQLIKLRSIFSKYMREASEYVDSNKGKTVFDWLKQPDTKENRKEIIAIFLKNKVKFGNLRKLVVREDDVDSAVLRGDFLNFNEVFLRINSLFNGEPYLKPLREAYSLVSHENLSAGLAMVVFLECKKHPEKYAKVLKDSDLVDVIYATWLHDLGRLVTHDLDHDEIVKEIFDKVGIRSNITSSIHEPVPIEDDASFNIETYDTPQQMIVRIIDLLGKLDENGKMRTSIEAISNYSLERQMMAFNKGDFVYEGKSEEDVRNYCKREKQVLERAVHFLYEDMGIDIFELVQKINDRDLGLMEELLRVGPLE